MSYRDIIEKSEKDVEEAIRNSSNKHTICLSYSKDKTEIEHAFKNYLDTLTRKNYPINEFNPNENYFGRFVKDFLDSIANIKVDTIIYDTSCLKCFVTIIYQTKFDQYFGIGFIGYRTVADTLLNVFPLQYTSGTAEYSKIDECRTQLRNTYFIQMRETVFGQNYSGTVTFEFSPLDKEFWTGHFFMKVKEFENDSLYYFERDGNFNVVPAFVVR